MAVILSSNGITIEQKQVIMHNEGPALVIAGPGSGKTFTIIKRILRLVKEATVSPKRILMITFTKNAALEMEERYKKESKELEQKCSSRVEIGTFHSFFYSALREFGMLKKHLVMPGNDGIGFFVTYFVNLFHEEYSQNSNMPLKTQKAIQKKATEVGTKVFESYAKIRNESKTLSNFSDSEVLALFLCKRDIASASIVAYERYKNKRCLIDFEDMQTLFLDFLISNPNAISTLQNRFDYIMIDEFQDINPVQFEIVKMISFPKNNLLVVGDEDQAIYAFRGSDPSFFINFEKTYSNAKSYYLSMNFRSIGQIVRAANSFIENNLTRHVKSLKAYQNGINEPLFFDLKTEASEKNMLVEILKYQHKKLPYQDMAILFRTHMQAERYFKAINDAGIAYRYENEVCLPIPGFVKHLEAIFEYKYEHKSEKIDGFFQNELPYWFLEEIENKTINHEIFIYKRKYNLIKKWLCGVPNRLLVLLTCLRYKTNPNIYLKALEKLPDVKRWYKKIEEGILAQNQDVLNVKTMHEAKGTEYELVYIPCVNGEFIPHPFSDNFEEERRILYVAMTRAKRFLYLSSSADSKFKDELKKILKFVHKSF